MSRAVAAQTMTGAPAPLRAPQTERAQERPVALPALTGLRFGAALWVVLRHFGVGATGQALAGHPVLAALATTLVTHGDVAVNLFFVLSGFVLAYSYLDRAGRLRGSARAFWAARIARLYPAYLLGLALAITSFTIWPFVGHSSFDVTRVRHPLASALATLLMVQDWRDGWGLVWNAPGWSLCAEALFYLVFPLIAPLCTRLPRRMLLPALALCWGLGVALALHRLGVPLPRPLLRLPEFVSGLLLGRLFVLRLAPGAPCGVPVRPSGRARHRAALAAAAPTLCVLLLVALLCVPGLVPTRALLGGALDPLCGLLIYGLARGRGLLATVAARPVLLLLGEASYALYILHWPLWDIYARLVPPPPTLAQTPAYVLLYVALATACALASLRYVEQPARRAFRRHAAAASRQQAAQQEAHERAHLGGAERLRGGGAQLVDETGQRRRIGRGPAALERGGGGGQGRPLQLAERRLLGRLLRLGCCGHLLLIVGALLRRAERARHHIPGRAIDDDLLHRAPPSPPLPCLPSLRQDTP